SVTSELEATISASYGGHLGSMWPACRPVFGTETHTPRYCCIRAATSMLCFLTSVSFVEFLCSTFVGGAKACSLAKFLGAVGTPMNLGPLGLFAFMSSFLEHVDDMGVEHKSPPSEKAL